MFGDRNSGAYMHKFSWTNIVRHQIVKAGRHPTTPRLPTTGPGDGAKRPCRSTTPPCGSTEPRTDAARSARPRSLPVEDRPQTPREWEHWLATTRKTIAIVIAGAQARRTKANPVSYTSTATQQTARHFCPPTSHQGLLEPDARKRARPVLRGARHSNAPGLPDPKHQCGGRRSTCSQPLASEESSTATC